MAYAKALRYSFAVITVVFGILQPSILPYATGSWNLTVLLAGVVLLGLPHLLTGLGLVLFASEWRYMMISYFSIVSSFLEAALWSLYCTVMALYALLIACFSFVMLWNTEDS